MIDGTGKSSKRSKEKADKGTKRRKKSILDKKNSTNQVNFFILLI